MKKRRVKRYDEGGETMAVPEPDIAEEGESERRSQALLRAQREAIVGRPRAISDYMEPKPTTRSGSYTSPVSESEESSSPRTFKQAFAEARSGGDKTFMWRGKKYTTEMAGESKPSRTSARSSAADESGAETARIKRQASEASKAAYGEEKQRQARMAKEQALETVSPESYLIGGPSLRALKGAAEALAAKQGVKAMGKRIEPHLGEMKDITPRPAQLRNEPLKIGREPLKLGMKKGGAVKKYSSGGSATSASKRADGIAQRGKTRGRIC